MDGSPSSQKNGYRAGWKSSGSAKHTAGRQGAQGRQGQQAPGIGRQMVLTVQKGNSFAVLEESDLGLEDCGPYVENNNGSSESSNGPRLVDRSIRPEKYQNGSLNKQKGPAQGCQPNSLQINDVGLPTIRLSRTYQILGNAIGLLITLDPNTSPSANPQELSDQYSLISSPSHPPSPHQIVLNGKEHQSKDTLARRGDCTDNDGGGT